MPSMSPKWDDILPAPSIDKQHHALTFSNPVDEIQRPKDQIQPTTDHDLRAGRSLPAQRCFLQIIKVGCYRNEGGAFGAGRMKNVGRARFIKGAPREAKLQFATGSADA